MAFWSCRKNGFSLGQKVGDKFTKLSKIGFSMECFTADFLQLFTKNRQNLAFGWTAEYSPLNPSISGIFLKFNNKVLSRSATRTFRERKERKFETKVREI